MSRVIPLQHVDAGTAAFRSEREWAARSAVHRHAARLADVWARLAKRYLIRRAIRKLNELDDRMLRDIGIDRSEIENMVRRGRLR